MKAFLTITNALSDENRVRALLALTHGELCVCQITELLNLAPSTVSKHVSLLHQAGLVEMRKVGRWVYYRLPDLPDLPDHLLTRAALLWATQSLAHQPRILEDAKRLKLILKENPEDICRRQLAKSKCCSSAPETPAAARWPKDGPGGSKPTRSKPTRPGSKSTA